MRAKHMQQQITGSAVEVQMVEERTAVWGKVKHGVHFFTRGIKNRLRDHHLTP